MYGPASGYVQTPSGGEPGTTSIGRPTLSELGIDRVSVQSAEISLGRRRFEICAGTLSIGMSGHATLDETLISQNNTFPAGTPVSANIQLDWYRAGYRYWLLFDADGRPGNDLAIAPSIGAGVLDFSYQLDGPGDDDVDRRYAKPTPLVGLEAQWSITDRFSVVGGVISSIPVADTPFILSTRLAAKYRVIDARAVKLDALLGIAFERIQYDDAKKQETPNDIDVNLGPLLLLGIRAQF